MARQPQTTEDKYALLGIVVGVAIAAVAAFTLAYNSSSMVRYLIMASGLVIGWLAGRAIARSKAKAP
jgi:gas vesicle protein